MPYGIISPQRKQSIQYAYVYRYRPHDKRDLERENKWLSSYMSAKMYFLHNANMVVHCHKWFTKLVGKAGIILGLDSATERRHYRVTPFLIGQAHTQHDPCKWYESVFTRDAVLVQFHMEGSRRDGKTLQFISNSSSVSQDTMSLWGGTSKEQVAVSHKNVFVSLFFILLMITGAVLT